jgi:phosphinothricin acetyltransferase
MRKTYGEKTWQLTQDIINQQFIYELPIGFHYYQHKHLILCQDQTEQARKDKVPEQAVDWGNATRRTIHLTNNCRKTGRDVVWLMAVAPEGIRAEAGTREQAGDRDGDREKAGVKAREAGSGAVKSKQNRKSLSGLRKSLLHVMTEITDMTISHWEDVRRIYLQGIATGNATFETNCPDWNQWNTCHKQDCRLIAITDGQVTGWAALSDVSGRCVYAGVAEISIYVESAHRGTKIGDRLLEHLVKKSEECGIWTLQAGIFPENIPSIRLHQKHGFRIVGTREKIGKMNGRWRDIILMERRSATTGID